MSCFKKGSLKLQRSRFITALLLIAVFFVCCTSKTFNNESSLRDYLQDENNGYVQRKSVNGYDFTLAYRPTDVLVDQELEDHHTDQRVKTLREKYSKYLYFNLSIGSNNQELLSTVPNNKNEFGAMVNQLAFGMQDKVHLFTQSKDTLEMVDFIYPRMYGMSKSTTILFVYPRAIAKLKEPFLNFTVEDLGLYTGEVKFKINTEKIQNEPQLSFKK